MRHEGLYLSDIVEASDHIAEFIAGADFNAFERSELLLRSWRLLDVFLSSLHRCDGRAGRTSDSDAGRDLRNLHIPQLAQFTRKRTADPEFQTWLIYGEGQMHLVRRRPRRVSRQ